MILDLSIREKECFDFLKFLKKEMDYVVIGGYAVSSFGFPRFSVDLDIVIPEDEVSFFQKLIKECKDKELKFTNFSLEQINDMKLDLIFLAMPNGLAMTIVPKLNCKIVDLSGDYRFSNVKEYEKVYGIKHLDEKRKSLNCFYVILLNTSYLIQIYN